MVQLFAIEYETIRTRYEQQPSLYASHKKTYITSFYNSEIVPHIKKYQTYFDWQEVKAFNQSWQNSSEGIKEQIATLDQEMNKHFRWVIGSYGAINPQLKTTFAQNQKDQFDKLGYLSQWTISRFAGNVEELHRLLCQELAQEWSVQDITLVNPFAVYEARVTQIKTELKEYEGAVTDFNKEQWNKAASTIFRKGLYEYSLLFHPSGTRCSLQDYLERNLISESMVKKVFKTIVSEKANYSYFTSEVISEVEKKINHKPSYLAEYTLYLNEVLWQQVAAKKDSFLHKAEQLDKQMQDYDKNESAFSDKTKFLSTIQQYYGAKCYNPSCDEAPCFYLKLSGDQAVLLDETKFFGASQEKMKIVDCFGLRIPYYASRTSPIAIEDISAKEMYKEGKIYIQPGKSPYAVSKKSYLSNIGTSSTIDCFQLSKGTKICYLFVESIWQ